MKSLVAMALVIGALVTAGCTVAGPGPTPNIPETVEAAIAAAFPTETPDIDATVEAGIRGTLEAESASAESVTSDAAPTITPTPSLAETIQRVRPAIVRIESFDGSGSGVIIETSGRTGIVLTNFHVIEDGGPSLSKYPHLGQPKLGNPGQPGLVDGGSLEPGPNNVYTLLGYRLFQRCGPPCQRGGRGCSSGLRSRVERPVRRPIDR